MKLSSNLYLWKVPCLGIAAVLALGNMNSVKADRVLFQDDFQSGKLANWEPADTIWQVIPDPDLADNTQKVLCTPPKSMQEYLWHTQSDPTASGSEDLQLTFRFNADQTNNEWNTYWTIYTDKITNASQSVNGYGVRLGTDPTTPQVLFVKIYRKNADGGLGTETEIADSHETPLDSLKAGWNSVKFRWAADGTLTVWINNRKTLSKKDTTYSPVFSVLEIANWLSNNAPIPPSLPDGRKIFFDDVKVEQVQHDQ